MEDKSPFNPGGAEFRAPTEDAEKEDDKKEKKDKKKTFFEWLKENVFKKEEKEDGVESGTEESGRVQKFVDSLKGWFNSAAGVEKDEVDEGPEAHAAYDHQPIVRMPLFTDVMSEPTVTHEEAPEDQQSAEMHNPVSAEEASNVVAPAHERTLGLPPTELVEDRAVDYQDPRPEESAADGLIDRDTPEPIIRQELQTNQDVGLVERPVEPDVIRERETVIERRGDGGAALLGFVAGEVLSRSRDAKLRKEGQELKKHVDKLEDEQQVQRTQQFEVDKATKRNKEQLEKLKQRRTKPETANYPPPRVEQKQPFEVQHTPPLPSERPLVGAEQSQNKLKTPEQVVASRSPEVSKGIILEQIEKAAEKDVALEGYYERRHEAKDVPSSQSPAGAGVSGGGHGALQPQVSTTDDDQAQLQQNIKKLQKEVKDTHAGLYKQAIKQGAWTGIILLVAFLILVFIWSLR